MEENKVVVPYIVTIYGTIDMERKGLDEIKDELSKTNFQYLINKADSKFFVIV